MITRLRLDAALYNPAPLRQPRQMGRPRLKGSRLPNLEKILVNPDTQWQTVTLNRWYGEGKRQVEIVSGVAVWYHTGLPVVPIRWVLVRDPQNKFEPQALLCTNQAYSPTQILEWFVRRWQMEVTFEEARAHLGMETQRQWSDLAIARTTPTVLALFSLVTLLTDQIHKPIFLGLFDKRFGTQNLYQHSRMHLPWYVGFYGLVLFQCHLNQLK